MNAAFPPIDHHLRTEDDEEPFYDADYYGHAPDEDEIADLRRTMRTAGPARAALIEARLVEMGEG